MRFRIEQPEFRGIGLARELGKIQYRAKKKNLLGKLTFILGLVTLVLGLFSLLGLTVQLPELLRDRDMALVTLNGLMINLLMVLLGLSWTGWSNILNGWFLLLSLRRSKGDTRFYEDHLDDLGEGLCVTYQYSKIDTVFEGKRAFYLRMVGKRFFVLVLQKKYFTQGEPDAFRGFIDEQCGKPVVTV